MVNIRPFQGYRYDAKRVDISKAVLPPYELANKEFKEKFLRLSDYNVIRIILGKTNGISNGERYQYSANLLDSWIKKGYLKKDDHPSIYVYSQEFEVNGEKKERIGFVSLVEMEELGKNIFPHEETLQETMINRRILIEKTKANFGLIFSLYSDPEKRIESFLEKAKENPPEVEFFTDYEGVRHRLWIIRDEKTISKIAEEMKGKKLLIADGHHRYKICLGYSKDNPDDEKAKYTSMMMVNIKNDGLVILPTHRLVKGVENFKEKNLIERLKVYFDVETAGFDDKGDEEKTKILLKKLNEKNGRHFGMYLGGEKYFIIKLKDEMAMDKKASEFSKPWRRFDMNILHTLALKDALNIDESNISDQCHMEYVKDIGSHATDCIRRVKNGECQIAFFVNPVIIEEMKKISEKGEMIPPKSTCFYPKVYSGVIIYKF